LRRQSDALLGHLFSIKSVWQLNQDTSAVTHQLIGTDRTPVIQVFKNLQGLRDDSMRLRAFNIFRQPKSWRTPKDISREREHIALQQKCQEK